MDNEQQGSLIRLIAEQQAEIERLRVRVADSNAELMQGIDLIRNEVVNTIRHENRLLMTLIRAQALPDDIISFWHEGVEVQFYVPDADTDLIQREIVMHKTFYQIENLKAISNRFDLRGAHVLDAGANIGNHSVYFSKICQSEVCYAFEPNPQAYLILEKNLSINSISGVKLFKEGLSDSPGMIYFAHQDAGNLGGTRFAREGRRGGVPCRTIDSLEIERLDFIKIDVEGMGHVVLRGASQTLANTKAPILIELFAAERAEAHAILEGHGYRMVEQIDVNDFFYECGR